VMAKNVFGLPLVCPHFFPVCFMGKDLAVGQRYIHSRLAYGSG
jgi:hypothetical protein